MTPSQAIRAINEALGWPRVGATVMIAGPTLDEIGGVLSHSDRLRRVAEAERDAEVKAHAKTRRDLCLAVAVLTVNAVIMTVLAVKYLRVVDLPKPVCLHPMQFTPTQIELAPPREAAEVWL